MPSFMSIEFDSSGRLISVGPDTQANILLAMVEQVEKDQLQITCRAKEALALLNAAIARQAARNGHWSLSAGPETEPADPTVCE